MRLCSRIRSGISLTAARNYMEGRSDNLRLAGRMSKVPQCLRRSLKWIDELEQAT